MKHMDNSIRNKLNQISAKIIRAENFLRDYPCVADTKTESLEYKRDKNGRFRIVYQDKPLIDCPIEIRIEQVPLIDDLVDDAIAKTKLLLTRVGL